MIVCPLYTAGERKKNNFDLIKFADLISQNSKTQVIIVKNKIELGKFLKRAWLAMK